MAANEQILPDELLIHSLITEVVLKEVRRIHQLPKMDRTDIIALEKYAKIYGVLMTAARENQKSGLFKQTKQAANRVD
jgi:phage terminase small subunit